MGGGEVQGGGGERGAGGRADGAGEQRPGAAQCPRRPADEDRGQAVHPRPVLPRRQQGRRAAAGAGQVVQRHRRRGQQRADLRRAGQRGLRGEGRRQGGVPVAAHARRHGGRARQCAAGRGERVRAGGGRRGDGISCDQADWADAKVVLADGRELWLGDLPLLGKAREPYSAQPPFSFKYGGRPSSEFLGQWKLERETKKLDDAAGTAHADLDRSPERLVRALRRRAVPRLSHGRVDGVFQEHRHGRHADHRGHPGDRHHASAAARRASASCGITPATCARRTATSRTPTPLPARSEKKFANAGGRPTQSAYPYYNLGWPGEGVIVVLSWPGQWAAQFSRDDSNGVRVSRRAGADPFQAAPGRGGPRPAGRPAVLAGRLAAGAERLAALDARPQPAPAGRQARPRRSWPRAARTSSAR